MTDHDMHHGSQFAPTEATGQGHLAPYLKMAFAGIVLVVVVGIYDAIHNLPVVTGCSFYGRCPDIPMTDPPTDLQESPVQ